MEEDLKAKLQENVEGESIPLRDVPQYFKDYTIDEVGIVMPQAIRPDQAEVQPSQDGVYDGPSRTREIDLTQEGETSKLVFIGEHLVEEESGKLKQLLVEYRDCFAWSYEDLKGIDEHIIVHTIPLRADVVPITQRPYRTNPRIAQTIQGELRKLLDVGFIYEIEHSNWVSPIVCFPKKNVKLRVCVDLKKLNLCTIKYHYPLPYIEAILERLFGHEAYRLLDGFSGYNQVKIHATNQHNTTFTTRRGIYAYNVIPFGLRNAPGTFQRMMCHAFKEFLRKFLEVFMDNLCVYSTQEEHLDKLRLVLERCQIYYIALNPTICQIMVSHGVVLGHIVSRRGIATNKDKVKVILTLDPPPSIHKRGTNIHGTCELLQEVHERICGVIKAHLRIDPQSRMGKAM